MPFPDKALHRTRSKILRFILNRRANHIAVKGQKGSEAKTLIEHRRHKTALNVTYGIGKFRARRELDFNPISVRVIVQQLPAQMTRTRRNKFRRKQRFRVKSQLVHFSEINYQN